MKTKLASLLLALALCLSLTLPASAAQTTLYLKQEYVDNVGLSLVDVPASEAVFILTGDVSRNGTATIVDYYDKVALFTANGSVKVDIQAYTKSYNPRNLPIGSSTSYTPTDTGYSCSQICIDKMKKTAAGAYEVETENPVFFDGQLEMFDINNGNKSIVSIKDYYSGLWRNADGMPTLASNASVTLSQPGVYRIQLSCDGPSGVFLMEVTGSAAPASTTGFSDVPANSPFADAIKWAVDQKITNGITTTTFGPSNTCTVSHILTFLYRANKGSASGNERDAVVSWAKSLGIDTGNLNAPCTRAMAVTYMWKAAGSPAPTKTTSFADVAAAADYAKAVSWAVEKGITNGTGGDTFSPGGTCTRGQIVTFLYRAK